MRMLLGLLAACALAAGCPDKRDATVQLEQPSASPAPAAPDASTSGSAAEEACVDRWLQGHKLDLFGSPEGTMYPGGTPLFDEATGERRPRLPYVYERQPDAKKACHPASP